ncbi:MAG: hypothetical protein JW876_01405 [Candidatus Krumholzibacteriota bacterium]|nr:hypothetical protein [Candidatus Krumholzibacteriota bacterium]
MRRIPWQYRLGAALVALSAAIYAAHWLLFRDAHHIFVFLVEDIAFVPVEVLLVTLIIHRLLAARERCATMNKMNMVIGAFFSDPGTDLLAILAGDATRAYRALALQWTGYLGHLRDGYPYLFSLAVRLNPFDPAASATIDARP